MSDLPTFGTNVCTLGAASDGTSDASPAFETAIETGSSFIVVPPGTYSLSRPIRLRSRTRLLAHPAAHLRIADGAPFTVHDALITNADWEQGDHNIEVSGGQWDGNNQHVRRAEEDERTGYTGNLIIFRNVKHLVLKDMKLVDPSSYFVCLSAVRRFLVEDIRFEIRHHTRNQDGIHCAGQCEDGVIRNITARGRYCPGDDMVALNADDALDRSETRAKLAGPIRRIVVRHLDAEDCHAFMRFASVWSTIEDIDVSDVRGGCIDVAINADALRFCRSPLFEIDDPAFAQGCGWLENIRLERFRIWKTNNMNGGLLQLHSRMKHFVVEDFERVYSRDAGPTHPTMDLAYIPGATGRLEGLREDQRNELVARSTDVDWQHALSAAGALGHASGSAGFKLGQAGRLQSLADRLDRLCIEDTPKAELPEPNWNKAMIR